MNRLIIPALVVLTLLGHAGGSHAAGKYTLACNFTVSHYTESPQPTSGSLTLTVEDRESGPEISNVSGHVCTQGITDYRVSDSAFLFGCEEDWAGTRMKIQYIIDRYTGTIDEWMGGLRKTGECQKGEKLF